MDRQKKRLKGAFVVIAAVILLVGSIWMGLINEYGAWNVNLAIVRFMESHDGKWPSSWSDLEPYHTDPVLGLKTTMIIRHFYGVAWDIVPATLLADPESNPENHAVRDFTDRYIPVVYRLSEESPIPGETKWFFTPQIYRFLTKSKGYDAQ